MQGLVSVCGVLTYAWRAGIRGQWLQDPEGCSCLPGLRSDGAHNVYLAAFVHDLPPYVLNSCQAERIVAPAAD